MPVGLDQSRFPGSRVTPCALARKEVFETALDGPARTQSAVFLVFSGTGNPLVKTVFLHVQRKLPKNSSADFTLLATIVTIVAEQPNFDAQEAQYTTKTTTPVATEGDEENKQNSEFSLVYYLALFLSRFKCAFFSTIFEAAPRRPEVPTKKCWYCLPDAVHMVVSSSLKCFRKARDVPGYAEGLFSCFFLSGLGAYPPPFVLRVTDSVRDGARS